MLVLSRKENQKTIIRLPAGFTVGPEPLDLAVELVRIKKRQVQIGFRVPDGIPVHREEVWERIRKGVA